MLIGADVDELPPVLIPAPVDDFEPVPAPADDFVPVPVDDFVPVGVVVCVDDLELVVDFVLLGDVVVVEFVGDAELSVLSKFESFPFDVPLLLFGVTDGEEL